MLGGIRSFLILSDEFKDFVVVIMARLLGRTKEYDNVEVPSLYFNILSSCRLAWSRKPN